MSMGTLLQVERAPILLTKIWNHRTVLSKNSSIFLFQRCNHKSKFKILTFQSLWMIKYSRLVFYAFSWSILLFCGMRHLIKFQSSYRAKNVLSSQFFLSRSTWTNTFVYLLSLVDTFNSTDCWFKVSINSMHGSIHSSIYNTTVFQRSLSWILTSNFNWSIFSMFIGKNSIRKQRRNKTILKITIENQLLIDCFNHSLIAYLLLFDRREEHFHLETSWSLWINTAAFSPFINRRMDQSIRPLNVTYSFFCVEFP